MSRRQRMKPVTQRIVVRRMVWEQDPGEILDCLDFKVPKRLQAKWQAWPDRERLIALLHNWTTYSDT